jgi:hypothetical protein
MIEHPATVPLRAPGRLQALPCCYCCCCCCRSRALCLISDAGAFKDRIIPDVLIWYCTKSFALDQPEGMLTAVRATAVTHVQRVRSSCSCNKYMTI